MGRGVSYKPIIMMRARYMKHWLPLLLSLLACPLLLQAQRASRSGLGYMGGPQAATWHSEATAYRPVPGFVAGLYAPIWVGGRCEIQPELLFSMQGAAKDLPDGGTTQFTTFSAVVPVSLKFFLNQTINLQAGVQCGQLLMATADGEDVAKQINRLDMGVNIGAGIGTRYGLDLTLRYYSGLSSILVEDQTIFPMNRTLQFTVGYRFMQFSSYRARR